MSMIPKLTKHGFTLAEAKMIRDIIGEDSKSPVVGKTIKTKGLKSVKAMDVRIGDTIAFDGGKSVKTVKTVGQDKVNLTFRFDDGKSQKFKIYDDVFIAE